MTMLSVLLIFIAGLCAGSFCNVLIYRIPAGEEFVRTRSHCMTCGHVLRWYELIPILSYILQGGRCRSCGVRLSLQYPLVELGNALNWTATFLIYQDTPVRAVLCCVLSSVLLTLAIIDERTLEIPDGLNLAVWLIGMASFLTDLPRWADHLLGAVTVAGPMLVLWLVSRGAWIGLGDVKLMAGAGLFLGWQGTLLALFAGCVFCLPVHMIRMHRGAGRKLAFGPWLAVGIWLSALFGEKLLSTYFSMFGL